MDKTIFHISIGKMIVCMVVDHIIGTKASLAIYMMFYFISVCSLTYLTKEMK